MKQSDKARACHQGPPSPTSCIVGSIQRNGHLQRGTKEHSIGLSRLNCLRFGCADSHLEGGTARGIRSRGVELPGAAGHACARRGARGSRARRPCNGGFSLRWPEPGVASLRCGMWPRREVSARARGSSPPRTGQARARPKNTLCRGITCVRPTVLDTLIARNAVGIVGFTARRDPTARNLAVGQPEVASSLHSA